MQPGKNNLKNRPFQYYHQKYYQKLRQPNCIIQPLNLLCGGWFLQTFKQVANKLSTNKTSPLPLFFPTIDSMELISKNKPVLRQVFKSFDSRGLNRIDASQLFCAFLLISKGSYQIYLKTILDIFGFQCQGRITREQFFFFLDSLFRSIPKIVIIKGFNHAVQLNCRLQFQDIEVFIRNIFGQKQDIDRNQIYEAMLQQSKLNQFIKYIQKRCTNSAQKYRNDTIQRVTIEAQVRTCMLVILQKVQNNLKK